MNKEGSGLIDTYCCVDLISGFLMVDRNLYLDTDTGQFLKNC